ncbi:cation:dicarboxylate symporter family transporter [Entomospira culicis]|uniref:Dicarboxylate/amino acid:cation symporter n=1 Tax=Entomospira culicis TaxID=2719989 RepID=A0A968GFR5_9SPIO|nr:cation:dicarboxylase symporter family transporter [Entomospira culicis]NIZ18771.1 dicarboxylate/amino acid:cation symporter [Entomospira culicis]NIZ68986.1 dicarboxylate/amino acid:cation symporter [Entomospira culicis]WDI37577.1 cation:dicarboxylase symporter family transporter [Entomospira culicis]WDI39205.1 cation:dicarboxylase symporter family transporter [Entomospira culicis]
MATRKKIPLLLKLVLGIVLGLMVGSLLGRFQVVWPVRVFATFNGLFSTFLSFVVPLLILSFVTMGIADLGKGAGRMLGLSVGLAYVSTAFFVGLAIFSFRLLLPYMGLEGGGFQQMMDNPNDFLLTGYFSIPLPPVMDVLTALVLAFVLGLGLTGLSSKENALYEGAHIFQGIIEKLIDRAILPLLPLHITGVFMNMSYSGEAKHVMSMMLVVFLFVVSFQILTLFVHFGLAGVMTKRNPFKLLWEMFPAYVTALGTRSSAASIPVTRRQMTVIGVDEDIADFTTPLFSAIHMPGNAISVGIIAFSLAAIAGIEVSLADTFGLIFMLGIIMVAAPGIPGGAILAAMGFLQTNFGFSEALITLAIAMDFATDPTGTATNVTADGALALEVQAIMEKKEKAK